MPSPFFFGGRITNPEYFVGRKKELDNIFSALETADSGLLQHVQVVGPRRIGKSSLLYYVTQTYSHHLTHPEKYRFVYVDLDDARCHTLEGLLNFILDKLDISHNRRPTLKQFQRSLKEFNRNRNLSPVILLDEFEHLTKRKDQFPDEVFKIWRSLGSNSNVAFVTASQTPLGELIRQGNLTSTFHNIFIYLPLGEFTKEEAQQLLLRSLDRPFTEEETKKILKLAKRHPAQLQIAAQLLYNARAAPPVDWNALKSDYRERLKNIQPVEAPRANPNWLEAIFIKFPTALGRFVLEVVKNKDASDRTAAILGWVILGLLILTLLGFSLQEALAPWLRLLISNS